MFAHVHEIDGATIVHSHIHGEQHTDNPTGGHTSSQAELIKHLTLSVALCGESIFIDELTAECTYKINVISSLELFEAELYNLSSPRAPPQFFV